MKTALTLSVILCISIPAALRANSPPASAPATMPAVLKLSLPPAAIPRPALKYALVPDVADQTPGEAAPLYLMAFAQLRIQDVETRITQMLAAPRDKFPVAEAEKLLGSYRSELELIEIAARRDRCDWEVPFREQGLGTLLPYLVPARSAGTLLALKARVQIAQGNFDGAVHTLQSGFGMVDHLKKDACLVQGLVTLAIAKAMLDRVEEFVQTPGAPNLYWALAELPRPLTDIRGMTRVERTLPEFATPDVRIPRSRHLRPGELATLVSSLQRISGDEKKGWDAVREKLAFTVFLASYDAPARNWLTANGYTQQQVKEMSAEQAVADYLLQSYWQKSDEMYKWTALPYWQARDGLKASSEALVKALRQEPGNPLLMLLPALGRVHRQIALTDRHLAMLQIAEALRGFAADHAGNLPASLADLTDTPAPLDPMTGKSFEYELAGKTAIVRSAAVTENPRESSGTWQITVSGAR